MLINSCEKHGSNTMINFPDSKYTYEEMFEEASKIAAGLYAFGLEKNDPVAIWGTNTDKWIIMVLLL